MNYPFKIMVKDALQCLMHIDLYVTPHFKLSEFFESLTADEKGIVNCPNTYVKLKCVLQNIEKLAQILEKLRICNIRPIYITSGYRCLPLNTAVGGVYGSCHTYGAAVDITAKDFDKLMTTCDYLELDDVTFIAYPEKRYIHIQLNNYEKPPATILPKALRDK